MSSTLIFKKIKQHWSNNSYKHLHLKHNQMCNNNNFEKTKLHNHETNTGPKMDLILTYLMLIK